MKTKRVALYARVSNDAQTTENQLLQLRAVAERHGWAIVTEFVDHGVSGAKSRQERQQFDALLRGVARREFDMIAAWSVDRLGRSLQDLLSFLLELQSKRVDRLRARIDLLHIGRVESSTRSTSGPLLSVVQKWSNPQSVELVRPQKR